MVRSLLRPDVPVLEVGGVDRDDSLVVDVLAEGFTRRSGTEGCGRGLKSFRLAQPALTGSFFGNALLIDAVFIVVLI